MEQNDGVAGTLIDRNVKLGSFRSKEEITNSHVSSMALCEDPQLFPSSISIW